MSQPYGATARPHNISKNLAKFGCEILHVCLKPPTKENDIKYLPLQYYVGEPKYKIPMRLYKECKGFSPDIIYAHQMGGANIGIYLKYLLNRPLIYDAHSSSVLEMPTRSNVTLRRKIQMILNERMILKLSNKVIVVSNELEKFLTMRYNIPKKKIKIVKNGVETDMYKPANPEVKIKRDLKISDDDKIVVFTLPRVTAFPSNDMALVYLFKMIPKIEKKISNIKFLILGGGPQPKPPSKIIQEL